jgi:uncharacterized protein YbaR (Trm112 family)
MSGISFDDRGLVCPACRARLKLASHKLPSAAVACMGCGRVYPIREGIPVLLIEEATQPGRPASRK